MVDLQHHWIMMHYCGYESEVIGQASIRTREVALAIIGGRRYEQVMPIIVRRVILRRMTLSVSAASFV